VARSSRGEAVFALVRRHGELVMLAGLGVLLSVIAFQFPPSGDDWAWGSHYGVDRLHEDFAGYNGRYLGNLAVLLLTRTPWLAPFVVAGGLVLAMRLIAGLSERRDLAAYVMRRLPEPRGLAFDIRSAELIVPTAPRNTDLMHGYAPTLGELER
jgi:hypothetical protein